MNLPYLPAWILALLFMIISMDSLYRYKKENMLPLIGKAMAWGAASLLYLLIQFDLMPSVQFGHASIRIAWAFVSLTEIAYRWAKRGL